MTKEKRYFPGTLTKSDLSKQTHSIKNQTNRPILLSFTTKRSPWVQKFENKYGTKITDLEFINKHILKKKGIKQILDKGRAAYYTSGSRPNQTQHSWAYARLAAVIMGGVKARKVDETIWGMYKVTGKDQYEELVKLFRPNLSPRRIFTLGSFGGTYWRPICSKVTGKCYENEHKKFPAKWFKDISDSKLTQSWELYDKNVNKYGVKVGTTLELWEEKKWIKESHPYGWVQWYCDWKMGKKSPDDVRQIKRWLALAGPNGRFRRRLINMIKSKGGKKYINNTSISPSIRQTLQHWGYKLTTKDYLDTV